MPQHWLTPEERRLLNRQAYKDELGFWLTIAVVLIGLLAFTYVCSGAWIYHGLFD